MLEKYLTPHVKRGAIYSAVIGIGAWIIVTLLNHVVAITSSLALPVTWVVYLLPPLVIGWLVARWAGATDVAKGAIDGAIATGVGGLVSGVVNLILGIIGLVALGRDTAIVFVFMIAAVVVFFIIGSFFAAALGAVGGLLYVAIQGSKKT